jgi:hypothetical protein
MHGLFLHQLRLYTVATLGSDAWEEVAARASAPSDFDPSSVYPDELMTSVVDAAAALASTSRYALLEAYGEWSIAAMTELYRAAIDPRWNAVELIENVTAVFHRGIVRSQSPETAPPDLLCERQGDARVLVTYSSPRMLCALAKGFIRGIARQYRQGVKISESRCMLLGAPDCRLSVQFVEP